MLHLHAQHSWKTTIEYPLNKIIYSLGLCQWPQTQKVLMLQFAIEYSDYGIKTYIILSIRKTSKENYSTNYIYLGSTRRHE